MTTSLACLLGVLFSLLATPLFARAARRMRWLDGGQGAEASRKLQARPVPPVGGAVVLLGLVLVTVSLRIWGGHWDPRIASWIDPWAGAASLVLAFCAGLIDDLRAGGLRARAKLGLQTLAATPAAASLLVHLLDRQSLEPGHAVLWTLALVLGAVVAQNAFNTFDNADGASTGLGVLALAFHAPVFAGPLLGFLPWNVNARARPGAAPTAYLGDAGSHLLGMLILLVPSAWPALALPLFDLARVSIKRLRAGSRPWVGDRRHLAHRLARVGLRPHAVCGLLLIVALPCLVWPGALGLALTAALFAICVGVTREPVSLRT